MLNPTQQQRMDALRAKEAVGELSGVERAELDAFFAELDREEAAALAPALARNSQRIAELENTIAAGEKKAALLEKIIEEQAQLLAESKDYLARLHERRTVLVDTYRRATGHELSHTP